MTAGNHLVVNSVIAWLDHDNKLIAVERVLWVSHDRESVFVININDVKHEEHHLPEHRTLLEVEHALENGTARKLDIDPFSRFMKPTEMYPQNYINKRDKAWKIIAQIVVQEPDIYIKDLRCTLIKQACEESGVDKKQVYRVLNRYWVRGKVMNALIPDYGNCGGSGKSKVPRSGAKLGRPRKVALEDQGLIGVNVTEVDRSNIALYARIYYASAKKPTYEEVYQRLLEEKYFIGIEYKNGKPVPILPPMETVFDLEQFKYHLKKALSDIGATLKRRIGKIPYALTKRPLLGNATGRAFGPGSVYEIDATITNVFLVSTFDRSRIIGRVVLYLVKDVFTRLVAGFYAGLEGPSWLGAMMAIENATTDKVAFCSQQGIEIEEYDWPSHHLPASVTGDRGEMESHNANNLSDSLGVRVDNAPPYRGDMKPFVERHFGRINGRIDAFVPGLVQKEIRERGQPDYRLGARLTVDELNHVLILVILEHNKTEISDYPFSREMTEDHVAPIPVELWNWGVAHGLGSLHEKSQSLVRLNLMPRKEVSVTRQGIYFPETKMHYDAEGLREKGWYDRAVRDGRYRIIVSYDPRNSNFIYIPNKDGTDFIKCEMTGKYDRFRGLRVEEVQDQLFLEEVESARRETSQRQLKAETNAQVQAIVADGVTQTEDAINPLETNASRVSNIRANRRAEKLARRADESWELSDDTSGVAVFSDENTGSVVDSKNVSGKTPVNSPMLTLLQKRQSERRVNK